MCSFNDAIAYGLQKAKHRDVREHQRKVIENYWKGRVFIGAYRIGKKLDLRSHPIRLRFSASSAS